MSPKRGSGRYLILSPHRDDAVLCLGGSLQIRPSRTVVVTLFSQTAWTKVGGWGGQQKAGKVTRLRASEDRRALRILGSPQQRALGLKEALFRGYRYEDTVFGGKVAPQDIIAASVRHRLTTLIASLRPSLILAPLGLGGHVDHIITCSAALEVAHASNTSVALYEDLPYAATLSDAQIHATAQRRLSNKVQCFAINLERAQLITKMQALESYRSQFSPGELAATIPIVAARRRPYLEERLYALHTVRKALTDFAHNSKLRVTQL